MSHKPSVVVAVLLAGGLLASCGLEHKSASGTAPSVHGSGLPSVHLSGQPTAPQTVRPTTVKPPRPVVTKTATGPTDNQVLTKNKLYSVGAMKSTGCHEPKAKPNTAAGIKSFYSGLLKCLNSGWPATVKAAGAEFRKPRGYVWFDSVDTPCGAGERLVSFYCPGDETIYLSGDELVDTSSRYSTIGAQWWGTHVLPHEYGHHIQELTGMMSAYEHLYDAAPSQAAKDQLTRRLELQASCLGHVFLMANKKSYPITSQMLNDWSWRTIRIPNHGSESAQRYWISRAVQLKRPGACNTWAAPASQVG